VTSSRACSAAAVEPRLERRGIAAYLAIIDVAWWAGFAAGQRAEQAGMADASFSSSVLAAIVAELG
jgi:hypothetical protein